MSILIIVLIIICAAIIISRINSVFDGQNEIKTELSRIQAMIHETNKKING